MMETRSEKQNPQRRIQAISQSENRATEVKVLQKAKEKEKANKGAWGMPVALGGDEGRDKLRKAAASGKCILTRRCPNGETRGKRFPHRC